MALSGKNDIVFCLEELLMKALLELKGIKKTFGGLKANDDINISLNKGEILALLGENGAGKTTLMNILYGLYSPDEGEIFIKGKKISIHSPIDAISSGIGMVHQHFMLIPVFTVTENVMLGNEIIKAGGILNREKAAKRIREISDLYKLDVDPDMLVGDLSVGVQQRIEIIKLLYRNADILIMDEPSAVLTPQEVDNLFLTLRNLVKEGKSIIFITHKLREVMEISDRVCVIRAGKVVGESLTRKANINKLASLMVGREVELRVKKKPAKTKEAVLKVEKLGVIDKKQNLAVNDVSFELHAGEILGIAGVQGNGQTELVRALVGLNHPINGTIIIRDVDVTYASPRKITELGCAHIPEDRQVDGLVLPSRVADNLILNRYYKAPYAKGIVVQEKAILETANELIKKFDIRPQNPILPVAKLSGGNQQKIITARELSRPIELIIASQPTRGLDVGSIEYTHKRLLSLRDQGCAILLVSTELDEIMQLSDRIAVMYHGKIMAILDAKNATKEMIGLLMAGIDTPFAKSANMKEAGILIS